MKIFKQVLQFTLCFICILIIVHDIFSDVKVLIPEEQEKLKEGKLFWEWNSPDGPLSMHYIEKGTGPKHILLLHGFRAHSYTWRYLIDPLSEAGYHVWSVDLIGYGLSDKPDHVIYHMNFFVQQLNDFMQAKGITDVHFIGNSLGGGLALFLTIAHPERTRSITLLSALGYPLEMPLYISICRHFSHLWTPFLGPRMIRYSLSKIVCNQSLISDEQVEAYSLPYRMTNGIISSLMTLQQFDNDFLLNMGQSYSSLTHPMLLIWGKNDTLLPMDHFKKFQKDFPNACPLIITDCGHIPQEEKPEEVLSSVLSFLETIDKVEN